MRRNNIQFLHTGLLPLQVHETRTQGANIQINPGPSCAQERINKIAPPQESKRV